jgi:hypothetical protein
MRPSTDEPTESRSHPLSPAAPVRLKANRAAFSDVFNTQAYVDMLIVNDHARYGKYDRR